MPDVVGVDFSQLTALDKKFKQYIPRWKRYHDKTVKDMVEETYIDVRNNAQGRPGPNVITGAYLASIQKSENRVWTGAPQAARLELGFTGVDSLGRHYHQPPFPHWRPAILLLKKRFPRQVKNVALNVWKGSA